ncbi:hypothetical protein ACIBG5_18445 [Kribbella sp. NPDC050241]|uniref:hypothetical protein n=1 Tax=Kribbella sp. NPDC050241 TaxID=3364115 RepID=UPI0037ADCBDD
MSTSTETTIANANAAPSDTVNSVVWVMNPGPIAEVAIRNIAPISVDRLPVFMALSGVLRPAAGASRRA